MEYSISPEEDGRYILLKVTGEYNRQLAMMHNIEAHALGRQLGIDRYLVDMTGARNVETALDSYQFAYEDMDTPDIDRGARVALLVSPEDHSHDFVETVSRNAGLDVTLFRDRDQALGYLLA